MERLRYSRHLMIPDVGESGQLRLKSSSVLLVGCGALGSPAALYLAAAGVGRIGLVDPDVVDPTNLQRQILHGQSWIGQSKLKSAVARLTETNPHVVIEPHPVRFGPHNAMEIASKYDVIVDGSDNFPTRFLTNDVAFFLGKPLVYGAIHRFEGQTTVFAPHLGGPCYRCLLPSMPAPGSVPSCQEAGVFGVLPGVIGTLQATEALKLLLKIGVVPTGKMTVFDALQSSFRSLKLPRDPACRLCGTHPDITSVHNAETTATSTCSNHLPDMNTITTRELRNLLANSYDGLLIDVREPVEHAICSIPEAKLIPLATLPMHVDSLPRDREILVLCKAGMRSARAVEFLQARGFTLVKNILGGMDSWQAEGS